MPQLSPTNWDRYYTHPYRLSGLTRYFTNRLLARLIGRYLSCRPPLNIVELGGGGSAFYAWLSNQLHPQQYTVVDNNQTGLDRLTGVATGSRLVLINHDIMQPVPSGTLPGDLVFSVGLIEHFPANLTERAIAAHFDWATDQGLVVIAYPTPTWLYWLSRRISERMGWWIFHDETPLSLLRVEELVSHHGRVMSHRINWTNPFTQAVIVVSKGSDNPVVG